MSDFNDDFDAGDIAALADEERKAQREERQNFNEMSPRPLHRPGDATQQGDTP